MNQWQSDFLVESTTTERDLYTGHCDFDCGCDVDPDGLVEDADIRDFSTATLTTPLRICKMLSSGV